MKDERGGPIYFRPIPENRKRLDTAKKLGFDMSELLNMFIEERFDHFMIDQMESRKNWLEDEIKDAKKACGIKDEPETSRRR